MKSILPIVFTLLTCAIYSQPIIPISSSPKVGEQWKQAITNETPDPGPSGQNHFWDFSEVTLSEGGSLAFNWIAKSEGINSECYEGATIAADLVLDGYGSGFAYGFYGQDQDGFRAYGESTSFGTKTIYQDPQEFKFVGLQYGESSEDTYYGTTDAGGFTSKAGGETTYDYDAYGSVVLPQATFDDVVRIHQVDIARDTFVVGALEEITIDTLESYAFIAEGSIFPIALWQSSITYRESYLNGNLIETELEDESLTFSINPDYGTSTAIANRITSDQIEVYPSSVVDNVTVISAVDLPIFIMDMKGNSILSERLISGKNILNVTACPHGHYLIYSEDGNLLGRFSKFN